MKKLSSYQKMKLENESLKQEIYNLVKKKNEIEGLSSMLRWNMHFDANEFFFKGDYTLGDCENFNGIFHQVNKT